MQLNLFIKYLRFYYLELCFFNALRMYLPVHFSKFHQIICTRKNIVVYPEKMSYWPNFEGTYTIFWSIDQYKWHRKEV